MWQDKGFIVDRNLSRLAKMLQEKGVDCMIPDQSYSQDSEQICSKALETDRIFITSNLKLFNKKSVRAVRAVRDASLFLARCCCVHYKDNAQLYFFILSINNPRTP